MPEITQILATTQSRPMKLSSTKQYIYHTKHSATMIQKLSSDFVDKHTAVIMYSSIAYPQPQSLKCFIERGSAGQGNSVFTCSLISICIITNWGERCGREDLTNLSTCAEFEFRTVTLPEVLLLCSQNHCIQQLCCSLRISVGHPLRSFLHQYIST